MQKPTSSPQGNGGAGTGVLKEKLFQTWGVREIVTTVLMSVLTVLIMFVGGMITMVNLDLAMIGSGGIAVFLGAPIFMFMALRVNRFGIMTVFATLASLMFCTVGNFTYMIPFYIVGGIALDLIFFRREKQRQNPWCIVGAWSVFSGLYLLSTLIPIVGNMQVYVDQIIARGLDQAYLDSFMHYYTDPAWVFDIMLITIACGFAGSLVGRKLCMKHFSKAGAL